MNYNCRLGLLDNSSTALGSSDQGDSRPKPTARGTFFVAYFTSFHFHSFLFAFLICLSYFNLIVFMCKCSEHLCMNLIFSIALINRTCFFHSAKTAVSFGSGVLLN